MKLNFILFLALNSLSAMSINRRDAGHSDHGAAKEAPSAGGGDLLGGLLGGILGGGGGGGGMLSGIPVVGGLLGGGGSDEGSGGMLSSIPVAGGLLSGLGLGL
ncbi:hypothetical protein K502DRAFT_347844 [Neoconidiobolus thromboides FSU 785]|nr:hypothetical protein K502DRAFT_347844 [Neoconidiobolus thromboides FSU 785]